MTIITTPRKALRLAHAALVIGLLAHSSIAPAQVNILPGESVAANFTANSQRQKYTVRMEAGERLLLHIESVGNTLFTRFTVSDPGDNRIEGSYAYGGELTHDLQSRVLSANGAYLIRVWNNRGVGHSPVPYIGR